jgi:sulfur carrier protein ThiS
MSFTLTFVGPISRPSPERVAEAQARGHFATVDDLLAHLGYQPVQFPHIAVLSDGVRLHAMDPVPDHGELVVMVPTGGG